MIRKHSAGYAQVALVCCIAGVATPSIAAAAANAPDSASSNAYPAISLETPPPQPRVQRTYHMHDGFYLRSGVGFGSYHSSFADGAAGAPDFDGDGGSMAISLLLGGAPSPGLTLGGGLIVEQLLSKRYERRGVDVGDQFMTGVLIGPFVDGYFRPNGGFHLGGMIGIAGQNFQDVNSPDEETTQSAGLGCAAWFGYDFWVAPEWSIGPELRLMGMRTGDTRGDGDIAAWARSVTLGVAVVYQ
jgi:hypothetical protein